MTTESVYGGREKQRSKEFKGNGNGSRGERKKRFSEISQNRQNSYGKGQNRYQGSFRAKDKDEDEDRKPRMSKPRRSEKKDEFAQVKEQQSDKLIMIKKFEKEQKAMKKKSEEKRRTQSSRPIPKQKRSNNINYTRQYENGMYEDYEDWYEADF